MTGPPTGLPARTGESTPPANTDVARRQMSALRVRSSNGNSFAKRVCRLHRQQRQRTQARALKTIDGRSVALGDDRAGTLRLIERYVPCEHVEPGRLRSDETGAGCFLRAAADEAAAVLERDEPRATAGANLHRLSRAARRVDVIFERKVEQALVERIVFMVLAAADVPAAAPIGQCAEHRLKTPSLL